MNRILQLVNYNLVFVAKASVHFMQSWFWHIITSLHFISVAGRAH